MEVDTNVEPCRICANVYVCSTMDFVNIFEPHDCLQLELNFIQFELKAWQLKIFQNDGLPQRICANCFTKFCSMDLFRQEIEAAQQKLLGTYTKGCNMNQAAAVQVVQETILSHNETVNTINGANSQTEQHNDNNFGIYSDNLANLSCSTLLQTEGDLLENALLNVKSEDIAHASELSFISAEPSSQSISFEPQTEVVSENAYTGGGDCIVQSKTAKTSMDNLVSEDLEDMLQGSIIPKPVFIEDQNESKNTKKHSMNLNRIATVEDPENLSDYDYNDDPGVDDEPFYDLLAGKPYACRYCYCPSRGPIDHLIFQDSESLSQHFFDVHDPNLPYTCNECPQTYNTTKLRDNHVRLTHNTEKSKEHQCPYCHKILRSSLMMHQYSCTYVGDWECEICGTKFVLTPLHRFRAHKQRHERGAQYKCKACGRTFVRRTNLETHERVHCKEAYAKCDQCDEVFLGEYKLKRHKHQFHGGEYPAKCDYCVKGFVTKAFLARHMLNFHSDKANGNDVSATTCDNCGIIFTSLQKLRLHQLRARDENGQCKETLDRVIYKHRQPRQSNFPCKHCPKRFNTQTQLAQHTKTHDNRARPYQCVQCHVACRTASELSQHCRLAHSDKNGFVCEICNESFTHNEELHHHMITHNEHLRNQHRTEIDIDMANEANIAAAALNGDERVRVELVNNNGPLNTLPLDENLESTYKPLLVPDAQIEEFFMGVLDPDHEIIVT